MADRETIFLSRGPSSARVYPNYLRDISLRRVLALRFASRLHVAFANPCGVLHVSSQPPSHCCVIYHYKPTPPSALDIISMATAS